LCFSVTNALGKLLSEEYNLDQKKYKKLLKGHPFYWYQLRRGRENQEYPVSVQTVLTRLLKDSSWDGMWWMHKHWQHNTHLTLLLLVWC